MESNIISVYRILECVQGKLVHCDISTCTYIRQILVIRMCVVVVCSNVNCIWSC